MPRHRSLNLKKFIDSIPEPLVEEYFKQKVGGGDSVPLKTFDFDSVTKFLDTYPDEDLKSSIREDFTHINEKRLIKSFPFIIQGQVVRPLLRDLPKNRKHQL